MNEERIDELAFEAGCHRHKYWDPKHPDLEGFIISRESLDKFAELIVQECCQMMLDLEVKYPANLTVQEIKQHFGVEE